MSEEANLKGSEGSGEDVRIDTQAEGENGGPQKPLKHRNRGGMQKKRATHFLCFPLVTEASVPQLAESLRHFKAVTTKPQRVRKSENANGNDEATSSNQVATSSQPSHEDPTAGNEDGLTTNPNHLQPLSQTNAELQVLPAISHRPAGTFHLTLGVMDLSTKEEMERALTLLQELDFAEIFRDVVGQLDSSGVPHKSIKQDKAHDRIESETDLQSLRRPISPPPLKSSTIGEIQQSFTNEHPPQINLTGVSTFPAAKTSAVFFAKPSPVSPFPLLQFAQAVRHRFREAGFITETRPLVLHATVANMRYATQAKGGRTSKGKTWRYGKERWKDGQVDAREIIRCFDRCAGNVEEYVNGGTSSADEANEYVWARGIDLNRVAICKMGAEKSDDATLGLVYPPVGQKTIFG